MKVQRGLFWRDIAASAYRAYASNVGWKNYQGNPMPQWEELPQPIQVAWEAAVRHAGYLTDFLAEPGVTKLIPTDAGLAEIEGKWAEWTPNEDPMAI